MVSYILSVGEPKDKMYQTIDVLEARLPPTLPRYLMGVGFPADLVAAVERGVDLFDCLGPARGGRNGPGFSSGRPPDTSKQGQSTRPRPVVPPLVRAPGS